MVEVDDFELVEAPLPSPEDGQALMCNLMVVFDPATLLRLFEGKNLGEPLCMLADASGA
jgi:NADPH-dependent curcumin reductase CurA